MQVAESEEHMVKALRCQSEDNMYMWMILTEQVDLTAFQHMQLQETSGDKAHRR